MGRFADLCGEIAASADEGEDGLVLPPEVWDRLRGDWDEADIEDALGLVHESLMQAELVDSADSLNARLMEFLGSLSSAEAFAEAAAGRAPLPLEIIGHLARRVAHLEDVLVAFRDHPAPERKGFDALRRRLADHGIEAEMDAAEEDAAAQTSEEED